MTTAKRWVFSASRAFFNRPSRCCVWCRGGGLGRKAKKSHQNSDQHQKEFIKSNFPQRFEMKSRSVWWVSWRTLLASSSFCFSRSTAERESRQKRLVNCKSMHWSMHRNAIQWEWFVGRCPGEITSGEGWWAFDEADEDSNEAEYDARWEQLKQLIVLKLSTQIICRPIRKSSRNSNIPLTTTFRMYCASLLCVLFLFTQKANLSLASECFFRFSETFIEVLMPKLIITSRDCWTGLGGAGVTNFYCVAELLSVAFMTFIAKRKW